MPPMNSPNENVNSLFDLFGVDVSGDFVEVINQPNLEATKIASIDSFAAMPKAITFPKLEPSLVLDVSAEVMRKNQLNFERC